MQWVRATDDTFCIAVLGDFLGAGTGSPTEETVDWVPHRATPDSVTKLAGLRPRLMMPLGDGQSGGAAEALDFSTLQDFDPGELFRKLDLFRALREARIAAKEGRPEAAGPSADPVRAPGLDREGGPGILDAILDASQPSTDAPAPGTPEEIEAFVRDAVRPHLVRDDRDARTRVAAVDEAASALASRLLHTEAFQRLEAIWRSLVFLLSRVDTTGKVRVYLVHLPVEALEAEMDRQDDPLRSRLHDLLSSPSLGAPGRRWALVCGAYHFGTGARDARLLARIARVARSADVPWISATGPRGGRGWEAPTAGPEGWVPEPSADWQRLRESPEAAWLGLTFPRFLLREPYGDGERRVKAFAFQEDTGGRGHLLWGEGPVLPAALMAQGFAERGWGFRPESHLDMGGMPLGNLKGGSGVLPTSVEVPVSPGEARSLIESGVIPLLGFPGNAGVRVGGLHSVAASGKALSGWWRG